MGGRELHDLAAKLAANRSTSACHHDDLAGDVALHQVFAWRHGITTKQVFGADLAQFAHRCAARDNVGDSGDRFHLKTKLANLFDDLAPPQPGRARDSQENRRHAHILHHLRDLIRRKDGTTTDHSAVQRRIVIKERQRQVVPPILQRVLQLASRFARTIDGDRYARTFCKRLKHGTGNKAQPASRYEQQKRIDSRNRPGQRGRKQRGQQEQECGRKDHAAADRPQDLPTDKPQDRAIKSKGQKHQNGGWHADQGHKPDGRVPKKCKALKAQRHSGAETDDDEHTVRAHLQKPLLSATQPQKPRERGRNGVSHVWHDHG